MTKERNIREPELTIILSSLEWRASPSCFRASSSLLQQITNGSEGDQGKLSVTETHRSLGFFRLPQVLDLHLVGVPGGQRGLGPQRPRCPVLFDPRAWLNFTLHAFRVGVWTRTVTTSTGGNGERSRHRRRWVFPQPVQHDA